MIWLTTPALALNPDLSLKQLMHTIWQAKDGLPPDSLLTIEQTADGFLWIATSGGLVRFDGEHFERIALPRDPKLKSASASSLCASRSGGLWIGFIFGGVGLLRDGRLKMYDAGDGLPEGTIRAIAEDRAGAVWVAASSGPARRDASGRWQRVQVELESRASIQSLVFDAGGTLWASGREGQIYRWPPGASSFTRHAPELKPTNIGIRNIVPTSDGSIWIVDDDTARRVAPSAAPSAAPTDPIRSTATGAYADLDGTIWTTSRGALLRVHTATGVDVIELKFVQDRLDAADGFTASGSVQRILATKDGQMWLLGAGSLERFSKRAVSTLDTTFVSPEFSGELGIGVPADGGVWVMPALGPLHLVKDGRAAEVGMLKDIAAIARMADGSTWAGGAGRFWRQESNSWQPVPPPADIELSDVQAISGKNADDAWVSVVRRGVYHWHAGTWRRNGDLSGLPSEPAVTLLWDPGDNLWLGYADGRIVRVHGSTVQLLSAAQGADIGVVTALYARDNDVWAGGEFGLRRWNGHSFVALRADRERAFELVTGIVETASGDVWLNSAVGIVRIPAADVAQAAATPTVPIVVDVFDRLDGYLGSGARVRPLPTALESKDGKLWFASTNGIFSIDPATSVKTRVPPRPLIKALVANGVRYEPSAPIDLKKGTRALQFDFGGLDLEVPERVRFRYRLDQVDTEWHDVGTQRQAFYTNLGAGQYRFHVAASSDGRIWSPKEAQLSVRIEPTFIQTPWFYATCLLASIGGIALLFRWRVLQLAQRLRWKLDAQLAERDRIARELHDTLLQSTQGLILSFQAISNRMPDGDANREKMETALERADEVLTEGRDRVRGLRRAAGGRAGLTGALRAFGEELAADAEAAVFRCESAAGEPLLAPEVADEIQRIVSEALLNAFRHGGAGFVELRIVNASDGFTLLVEDDGVGIDLETANAGARPGHWGLRGMRERSERIGARLTIAPRPGGGTRVSLVIATKNLGGAE